MVINTGVPGHIFDSPFPKTVPDRCESIPRQQLEATLAELRGEYEEQLENDLNRMREEQFTERERQVCFLHPIVVMHVCLKGSRR